MEKITENVYVESGFRGCNTSFVVTKEGVVIIDTPMVPADAKKWQREASKFGPIRYVIDTEPHIDHVSGNCYLGGTVVSHEGTRAAILRSSPDDLKKMLQREAPDASSFSDFRLRPPEITFSERLTLFLGEHTFQLINLPGHTPWQLAVFVPQERVVFASDNLNKHMPYFRQSVPLEWLESLKKLDKLDANKFVPGHGDVCDKSYVKEMSTIVKFWIDTVAAAIAKGMSSEEVQEKITFRDRYPELATDKHMDEVRRISLARIYEVLKK